MILATLCEKLTTFCPLCIWTWSPFLYFELHRRKYRRHSYYKASRKRNVKHWAKSQTC